MPRLAANLTMMFTELPFLDRFAAAAAAGFHAVEFLFPYDWPAEEISSRAKAAGVRIVLFNMPPGDWAAGERGIAIYPDRHAEFSAGLAKALHYANVLGVRQVHMMAGLGAATDCAHATRYRAAIIEASTVAASQSVDILLEPLNPFDMPGYFLNNFNAAAALITELALPNLKLQFDIYHRQLMHGNVSAALQQMLPIIGHIQIAAVPHRHEPDTGELNDSQLLALLDQIGYAGFVGCEYRPFGETVTGLAWAKNFLAGRVQSERCS